jgi:hypothetical protein
MTGTLATLYYSGWFNSYDVQAFVFLNLNWAVELAVGVSKHYFAIYSSDVISNIGRVDIRLRRYQGKVKYFFPIEKLKMSAPFVSLGIANFERQYTFADLENKRIIDSSPGVGIGGGIDIPLLGRGVWLRLESIFYSVQFPDELSGDLTDAGFPNLAGDTLFIHSGIVFSW